MNWLTRISHKVAKRIAGYGMAAFVTLTGALGIYNAQKDLFVSQDQALASMDIEPGYLPDHMRSDKIQVAPAKNVNAYDYALHFMDFNYSKEHFQKAWAYQSELDYSVRWQNATTGALSLCTIFNITTPQNVFAYWSKISGVNPEILSQKISAKELATWVILHEFRHCVQPVLPKPIAASQDMFYEAEADADAIRAIEKKNPGSPIREVVLALRVYANGHKNALMLKYILENKKPPQAEDMAAALKTLHDFKASGKTIDFVAQDKTQDPLVREWAALEISSSMFLYAGPAFKSDKLKTRITLK